MELWHIVGLEYVVEDEAFSAVVDTNCSAQPEGSTIAVELRIGNCQRAAVTHGDCTAPGSRPVVDDSRVFHCDFCAAFEFQKYCLGSTKRRNSDLPLTT